MASDEGEGEVWSSYHGGEDVLVEGGRHPQLVSLQKSRRNAKHPPWKRASLFKKEPSLKLNNSLETVVTVSRTRQ